VPEALIAALEAGNYEDAMRNAISLGGEADTLACITGGIAEGLFGPPEAVARATRKWHDGSLLDVVDRLYADMADERG
jgi:ADP-ribosylglycohydrolase